MAQNEVEEALNHELETDSLFRECWWTSLEIHKDKVHRNSSRDWNILESRRHQALTCYLLEYPNVSRRLNRLCREAVPEPSSWDAFPFKGLWFFLLRAFEMLPPCTASQVFRAVSEFTIMTNSNVPCVQFLSTSLLRHEAEKFAIPGGVVLTINNVNPRYLKDVSFYTVHPDRSQLLIWPLVTFRAGDGHGGSIFQLHWWRGATPDCEPRNLN